MADQLRITADASNRAANSLKEEREEQVRRASRHPEIRIALYLENPGEQDLQMALVGRDPIRIDQTVIVNESPAHDLTIKTAVINIGTAPLNSASLNIRTASLDGEPSPTISPASALGIKFPAEEDDDSDSPFTSFLVLPIRDLAPSVFTESGLTGSESKLGLRILRSGQDTERRFRLYVSLLGDVVSPSGVVSFHVRFGNQGTETFLQGQAALQNRNFQQAFQDFQQAANHGDWNAMEPLGYLYEMGLGTHQDCEQAIRWYKKAIREGGVAVAMNNLGYMYELGHCVPRNYKIAKQLFENAASTGGFDAMNNLGYLYQYGRGVDRDYEQALEWYSKAVAGGNARAMANLGYMYEAGFRTPGELDSSQDMVRKSGSARKLRCNDQSGEPLCRRPGREARLFAGKDVV